MRTATNFREAREVAKAFQGKPLINQQTGMTAVVSRKSLDKMLSESAVAKSESASVQSTAVANADMLFERAVWGWSKPDRASNPDLKAIHRFFALMQVNGRMKMVKLTVKEMVRPERNNPVYTLEAVDFGDDGNRQWLEDAAREDGMDLDKENPQRGEREGEIANHDPRASRIGFRLEGQRRWGCAYTSTGHRPAQCVGDGACRNEAARKSASCRVSALPARNQHP